MQMEISCVIVDDEYLAIRILEDYCRRIPFIKVAGTFKEPFSAMQFLRESTVDLLFLDIQMPRLSGMDIAAHFEGPGGSRPLVIFTTAAQEFAVKAFELSALDYLVKPISFQRFEKAVRKAEGALATVKAPLHAPVGNQPEYLLLRSDHRTLKVPLEEIVLIEGLNEYIKVHTPDRKLVSLAALKDLETRLPRSRFVRIHKSYIISLAHIQWWSASEVEIAGGLRLPVGRVYKEQFLSRLQDRTDR